MGPSRFEFDDAKVPRNEKKDSHRRGHVKPGRASAATKEAG
jgi:hypothetical protein